MSYGQADINWDFIKWPFAAIIAGGTFGFVGVSLMVISATILSNPMVSPDINFVTGVILTAFALLVLIPASVAFCFARRKARKEADRDYNEPLTRVATVSEQQAYDCEISTIQEENSDLITSNPCVQESKSHTDLSRKDQKIGPWTKFKRILQPRQTERPRTGQMVPVDKDVGSPSWRHLTSSLPWKRSLPGTKSDYSIDDTHTEYSQCDCDLESIGDIA